MRERCLWGWIIAAVGVWVWLSGTWAVLPTAAVGAPEAAPPAANNAPSEPVADKGSEKAANKAAEKAVVRAEKAGDKAAEKPAEKPGDEAANKGAEAAEGEEEETPERPSASFLAWVYNSMGTRYAVIFMAVTFNGVALVVMILLALRRRCICPLDLVDQFEVRLDKKEYQQAYDLARDSRSLLGRVLATGMAKLSEGYDAALEAMEEVGEEQNMRLEQRNSYIALIAQIGPMLGLLATVEGIVHAFNTIAAKDVTPKPSELAQGIGLALVNTAVGLWIAIPAIIFFHYIRNRLTRQVMEVGTISGRLMKRFSGVTVVVKKA